MTNDEKVQAKNIILNNEEVYKQIDILKAKYQQDLNALEVKIIAPCQLCPYDGVYRCEACQECRYEGFNVSDYPR